MIDRLGAGGDSDEAYMGCLARGTRVLTMFLACLCERAGFLFTDLILSCSYPAPSVQNEQEMTQVSRLGAAVLSLSIPDSCLNSPGTADTLILNNSWAQTDGADEGHML